MDHVLVMEESFASRYSADAVFRGCVQSALTTYEEAKDTVQANYGKDGLREYEDALSQKARKIMSLIPKEKIM